MATVTLNFKDKKAKKFFSKLHKNFLTVTQKKRKWVQGISIIVHRDIEDHFDEQMGSESSVWQHWSVSYLGFMRRKGRISRKILQGNQRMRGNFKPSSYRTTATGLQWFNNAKTAKGFPYAAAHDKGGPKLPKRRFMWLSRQAKKNIAEATVLYMLEGRTK